jgi:membrane carboxypeptidase/penicillin-binding protein
MKTALQGVPEQFMPEPEGIAQAIIDPASGRFAASGLIEYFYAEQTPAAQAAAQESNPATTVETP